MFFTTDAAVANGAPEEAAVMGDDDISMAFMHV